MNEGHYTAEQIANLTPAAGDLDMRVFFLQEDPRAGWYVGSALGAQKWAIALGGTAEYLGTLEHVLKGEIIEDGEYV